MRTCDQRVDDPKDGVCGCQAPYICSLCKKDFCGDHTDWGRGYALCSDCNNGMYTVSSPLCQVDYTKVAVTTCESCNKSLCGEHSYPTRLGRFCPDCMEAYRVPILSSTTRVRVPDSPTGGTRTAEVRPKGIPRTARLITMNKLLTAGGSYLQPGGAILEIEGQEDLDLTEGQFKALFEEI